MNAYSWNLNLQQIQVLYEPERKDNLGEISSIRVPKGQQIKKRNKYLFKSRLDALHLSWCINNLDPSHIKELH